MPNHLPILIFLSQGTELVRANEDFAKKTEVARVSEQLINAVIYLEETVSPQVCVTPEADREGHTKCYTKFLW